jgi:hypothetical protein
MSNMRSLEEQIANKCIHFSGIMDEVCKAGIKYRNVRVDEGNGPYKFPCLKQGGECAKCEFPTDEQIRKRIEQIDSSCIKAITAMAAIKEHCSKTKEQTGKVTCQCGGELHYTVAQINGHVWAKCKSCGLSFNE